MYKVRYPGPFASVDVPDLGREGLPILDEETDEVISPGAIKAGEVVEIEDKDRAEHAVAQGWEAVDWEPEGDPAVDELAERAAALVEGTTAEVIDRIAGDSVLAAVALEQERKGKNRTTLVEKLFALAGHQEG